MLFITRLWPSGTIGRLRFVPLGPSMQPRKPLGDGIFHQVTLTVQVEFRHDPLSIGANRGYGQLVGLLHQANYRGQIIVHSSTLTAQEAASYRALGVGSIVVKPTPAEELLKILEAFIAS